MLVSLAYAILSFRAKLAVFSPTGHSSSHIEQAAQLSFKKYLAPSFSSFSSFLLALSLKAPSLCISLFRAILWRGLRVSLLDGQFFSQNPHSTQSSNSFPIMADCLIFFLYISLSSVMITSGFIRVCGSKISLIFLFMA